MNFLLGVLLVLGTIAVVGFSIAFYVIYLHPLVDDWFDHRRLMRRIRYKRLEETERNSV